MKKQKTWDEMQNEAIATGFKPVFTKGKKATSASPTDQATPRPWSLLESFTKNAEISHFIESGTPSTRRVIAGLLIDNLREGSNEANGRLIVQAVNCHAELIECVELALERLDISDCDGEEKPFMARFKKILKQAKQK